MGIKRFFNQNVTVRRLKTVSGYKKAFRATATVDSHIQDLDGEARQVLGILEGRAWEAWFDVAADIQEGDKITDSKGIIYKVREVTQKDYGINQHLQVILEEYNE